MSLRAMATATLSFGLVTIPVKVYSATSSNAIGFNRLTKAGNRVRQKLVDSVTGKETTHNECQKGYEYAKNQFVVFTDAELEALESSGSNKSMAIQEFVDATTVDTLYVEKTYYLGPDKGGDRGYSLLSRMMSKLGKVAVAQWTSHNREHLVLLRPYQGGILLQQCFYEDEVRDFTEIQVAAFEMTTPEEVIAEKLLNVLSTGAFEPAKYEDRYAKRVREMVDMKVAGKEIAVVPEAPKTSVLDLFAALKASVDQVETPNPPAPEKPRKRRKTGD